jgi:serine/threonine protein kinase
MRQLLLRLSLMTLVDQMLSGRYRIERMLGQGGMSDVFRALDTNTGEPVAVKVVRSADPDLARRLAQEAKALARLEHPGLVRFLDAGVHDEQAFLVMELVEGPTLAERLRRGALSPARTAVLGRTLADALDYVHTRGIVHRDVKPANILLGPRSRVRLADFGIARMVDASSLTVTGTTLGTAAYMAPEQLEHHVVGTAADVWSLGVILLECLTGQRAFEGTAPEVVARRLAGPVPLPHDLPPPWRLVLEGMLAPPPERRPSAAHVAGLLSAGPFAEPWRRDEPTTAALASADSPGPSAAGPRTPAEVAPAGLAATAALGGDGHGGTLLATPPPAPSPDATASRRRRRRRVLWVALAVAVIAAAALSAWALSSQGAAPHHGHSRSTTSSTSTSTTTPPTTTSSTPTTTVPTASSASGALVRDAQAGVAAGSLSAGASRTILDELNQALSASSSGDHKKVSSAIGAMEATIAKEVQAGRMPPAEASTLEGDVATLATALGATTSATTTPGSGNTGNTGNTGAGTTTTTTSPPDGGGH